MTTLWIGDFRAKQLQSVTQQAAEYHYLINDQAEYSWFINGALPQLQSMTLEEANIVIMLGFIDCLYSCAWNYFKADKIAGQYAEVINELAINYDTFNIYVCTVNPINSDYPFLSDTIAESALTEKIKLFNKTLKNRCAATIIDSYSYLANTSFSTHDGVRYLPETSAALLNYVETAFKSNATANFLQRTLPPDTTVDSFLYWTPKKQTGNDVEGVNPYKEVQNNSVLPSSAAYAWGRFYEIIDEEPKLSTGAAKDWYSYTTDSYKRGQEPIVGAIACWNDFVAIVEQVNDDGSIITSESDWDNSASSDIWRRCERVKGDDNNWGRVSFQGFIYCPTLEVNTSPKISNFKVDKCLATEAAISFLVTNCKTTEYTILKDELKINNGSFSGNGYKTIKLTDLEPNTSYIVKVDANNKENETVIRELAFTTKQDNPSEAIKVDFTVEDRSLGANSKFNLKINKPSHLGYWRASSGYAIQLVINNKVVKTITETNAAKNINWANFTLKDKFSYEAKLGDNIQVGVRVWVKNSSGTKIYDSDNAKMSKAICLSHKPIKLYINK